MRKNTVRLLLVLWMAAVCLPALNNAWAAEKKVPTQVSETNYKNVDSLLVVFTSTRDVIRELVPAPLIPNEEDQMFLVINRSSRDGIDYKEMVIGIPVSYQGEIFSFRALCVVDNETISAQDQAAWGVKKPLGRITLEKKDGRVIGMVEMEGRVLVRVESEQSWVAEALDIPPVIFLSEIPDSGKEASPRVKQLVWGTFENVKVHENLYFFAPVLKINKTIPGFPRGIPLQALWIWGSYKNHDFTLKRQGILFDYLKNK